MKQVLALMESLAHYFNRWRGIAASRLRPLPSDREPELTQDEIDDRLALLLRCGF